MPAKTKEAKQRQTNAQRAIHEQSLDRLYITVPKGKKDVYKAIAERRGISLNKLITSYLEELEKQEDQG